PHAEPASLLIVRRSRMGKKREHASAGTSKADAPLSTRSDVHRRVGKIARKRREATSRRRFAPAKMAASVARISEAISAKPQKRRGCPQQARTRRAGKFHPAGTRSGASPRKRDKQAREGSANHGQGRLHPQHPGDRPAAGGRSLLRLATRRP